MFITHAAIMFSNGEVVEGYEYSRIQTLSRKIGFQGEHINGFITSSGDFVTPNEAAKIALKAGQVHQKLEELSPDDLWPGAVVQ